MIGSVRLKGNLRWEREEIWFSRNVHTPYTVINGKRYELSGVSIEKFDLDDSDVIYRLNVDFRIIGDYLSLQSAMVKAEEILRDFKFHIGVGGKYLYIAYENGDNNYKVSHTIIGWKKAYDASHNELIVKVRIPKGTRCNLTTTKCRAEKAEVVGVYQVVRDDRYNPRFLDTVGISLVRLSDDTTIHSIYAIKTYKDVVHKSYKVGDTLEITDFDTTFDICSSGIHFFRTVMKAINFRY